MSTIMHRIWSERPIPSRLLPLLGDDVKVSGAARDTPDDPFEKLPGSHAVIAAAWIRYDASFMDRVPTLRVISRSGIGYDNIDVEVATARGVAVCNAPEAPSLATAEHTIAMMFAVTKHLKWADRALARGEVVDFFTLNRAVDITGRKLGLVGLGRIGGLVAGMASGLGMRVCAYDPYISAKRAEELGIERAPSLDDLLSSADVVSLHLPLTAKTRHLMNAARLKQMKPQSYLVNCGRGPLVDEAALLEALESGHLSGAALDVFEREPPPADHPLLQRDDVIATPHIASATAEGKDRLWQTAIVQAVQVLRGERPDHLVNPDVWHPADAGRGTEAVASD